MISERKRRLTYIPQRNLRWLLSLLLTTISALSLLPAGTAGAMPRAAVGPQAAMTTPIAAPEGLVSMGISHTCAIRSDGTVVCWGNNSSGKATPPAGNFIQLSAGDDFTCALRDNGTIACWGAIAEPPAGTFTQISANYEQACALRSDGTINCWGDSNYGKTAAPAGTYTQISTGGYTSCAVRSDGALVCWGANFYDADQPPAGTFTQVSMGEYYTGCGVRSDGVLVCWGDISNGVATPPTGTFAQVSVGGNYACGLRSDGTLACWGDNSFGQVERVPLGTFTRVNAGELHACALSSNGTLQCWGKNDAEQTNAPAGTFGFGSVVASTGYTCRLKSDGTIQCWGDNSSGLATPPAGTFVQIDAGFNSACGLRSDGTVACWGDGLAPEGTFVQITVGDRHRCALRGDGTTDCTGEPTFGIFTPPGEPGEFVQLSAGPLSSCAILANGTIDCWGLDLSRRIDAPTGTFTQVSVGEEFSCGLRTDGTIACWGPQTPTPPTGTFTQISVSSHACAIRDNGTLACWGNNESGEATPPEGTFVQASTGGGHSCGIRSNGDVTCWGRNNFGQLSPDGIIIPAGDYNALVNAINSANASPDPNTIRLVGGTYALGTNNGDTGIRANALPVITTPITLTGEGADATILKAADRGSRIFEVAREGNLTLEGVTVRDGSVFGETMRGIGGGILNSGTLTVKKSRIVDNFGTINGGIANMNGTVTIIQSTLAGNSPDEILGNVTSAIESEGGTVTILDSTIAGNKGGATSGTPVSAIAVYGKGKLVITNSTIANNADTGIFVRDGAVTLTNITVTENRRGIIIGDDQDTFIGEGTGTAVNTLIARNRADCAGPLTSQGFNFIGDPNGCIVQLKSTDRTGDPKLGAFTDNGAPGGGYFPPSPGSPLIDEGTGEGTPATDQLGTPRPQDGNSNGRAFWDIGAIEYKPGATGSANATTPTTRVLLPTILK